MKYSIDEYKGVKIIVEKLHEYKTQKYVFVASIWVGKKCIEQILKSFQTKKQALKFTKNIIKQDAKVCEVLKAFA